jgi:hypothetical protein
MDAGSYPQEMVVFGMEQRVLDVQEALENCLQLDLAQQVFADLAGELGTEALALKPRDGDGGVGVAKVGGGTGGWSVAVWQISLLL